MQRSNELTEEPGRLPYTAPVLTQISGLDANGKVFADGIEATYATLSPNAPS